jgi:predicted Fe-Mo cluster-binding NifX family protein
MKIAFTAKGPGWDSMMDPRFGRAPFIVIYDERNQTLIYFDNSQSVNDAHGAGTATVQKIFDLKPDIIITGNGPGTNSAHALEQLSVKIFVDVYEMTVKQAYELFKSGKLKEL